MADVTTVVETAEAVAEVAAPVVMTTGCLDWKKVAIWAGATTAVGIAGYCCYKMVKKRKAAKEELLTAETVEIETEEVVEE